MAVKVEGRQTFTAMIIYVVNYKGYGVCFGNNPNPPQRETTNKREIDPITHT